MRIDDRQREVLYGIYNERKEKKEIIFLGYYLRY